MEAHIEELIIILGHEAKKVEKVIKKFLEDPGGEVL